MGGKLMMQTEAAAVFEPCYHGRDNSSSSTTMPQQRTPSASCCIHAAISVVRQHSAALMETRVARP